MKRQNRNLSVLLYCLLAAAVCLAICSKSSFLYPINDWTDANAYFSCGKGMLHGRVMYRDLYEHKGPLLYALHALCCLVDSASFLGVLIMEILSMGLFLMAACKLLSLYGAKRSALLALPLIGALVISSFSFQQGDSAEELCMPMLAWSLYGMMRWLRLDAPRRMAAKDLALHGFLCGCVLWVKFTMLGFYAPWLLGMMAYLITKRRWKDAFSALGWFALGVGVSTLPWLVYFGVNGAIVPWLKTYLYDNVFLYQDGGTVGWAGRLRAIVRSAWDWFTPNWAYTAPMALGLLWFSFRKGAANGRTVAAGSAVASASAVAAGSIVTSASAVAAGSAVASESAVAAENAVASESAVAYGSKPLTVTCAEKWMVWALLAFTGLGVFIGGKSYVYYGLILAVFTPLCALPLCAPADRRLVGRKKTFVTLACAMVVGAGVICLAASPNTPDLLKPRSDTMQYRFAEIVNRTPNATLLNYGFMDAGFYTACNIAPTVKYFHQTNVHLQEMLDEQTRYVTEGVTDYVVTRGRQPGSITDHYELIAVEKTPKGFWYDRVYLYRRKGLAP